MGAETLPPAVTDLPDRSVPLLGVVVLALAALANLAGFALLLGLDLVPDFEAALARRLEPLVAAVPVISASRAATLVLEKTTLLSIAVLPVLLLEAALAGWRECSLRRLLGLGSVSSRYDLMMFLMHLLHLWKYVMLLFTLGGFLVATLAAAQIAVLFGAIGLRLNTGWLLLDTVLAFGVFTFTDYWSHRLFHTRRFWPLHRMHHSATELTGLTLWRNHPAAPAIDAFFKMWPLALFDVPPAIVAGIGTGVLTYQHLIHSNIGWTWGWFGRWILLPPAAHRLHHAADPALYGRNLGIPAIWDRLFGTYADPRLIRPDTPVGVPEGGTNTGRPHLEALHDLRDWLRGLAAAVRAGRHRPPTDSAPGAA